MKPPGVFRRPFTPLGVGIAVSAIFFVLYSGFGVFAYYRLYATQAEKVHLAHVNQSLAYLDEVLTMSAYMAVATDEPRWERRYWTNVPELHRAIGELRSMAATDRERQLAAALDSADEVLLRTESDALARGRKDPNAGIRLLDGEEYRNEKATYRRTLAAAQDAIVGRTAAQLDAYSRQGLLLIEIGVAALVLLLLGARRVFTSLQQHVDRLRQSENSLARSEGQYRSLVEGSPYGILTLNGEKRIVMANPAMAGILRYPSPAEVLGLSMIEDLAAGPEEREVVEEPFRGGMRAESLLRRADGTVARVRTTSRAVTDPAGGTRAEVTVEDITERRELEEKLRHAQKLEAVGRLAGGIAHDFNNLLTIIAGYGAFLSESLDASDPRRASVEEILKAASRAADLTKQILAFGRRQMLEVRTLDLNGVVLDAEKMLRRLLGEDIALTVALAGDTCSIRADPGQIYQIVMNLAVNARDAMPEGGSLTIGTRCLDLPHGKGSGVAPGDYVVLSVSDTGVGMTEEVREHVFEPFFTTKQPGQGTGLGLATVYGVVKQSGGFIEVESEPGIGSSFHIYLPAIGSSVPAPPEPSVTSATGIRIGTILLAEDETGVRALARTALKKAGYQVLEAGDGTEALRVLREHVGTVELLITDLIMPKMNGRELADAVREICPGLPVLYMSGYTDDAVIRIGLNRGEVDLIQKPFRLDDLLGKVDEILRGKGGQAV